MRNLSSLERPGRSICFGTHSVDGKIGGWAVAFPRLQRGLVLGTVNWKPLISFSYPLRRGLSVV
jgi:hypothetical protein